MKNVKGKPITFADWERIGKRYGGQEGQRRVEGYKVLTDSNSTDEVMESEMFMMGLILGDLDE